MAVKKHNKKKTHRRKIIFLVFLLMIILVVVEIHFENRSFGSTDYTVYAADLPLGFDGYKIVQISDLHCAVFGENNQTLLDCIRKEKPDMIALTGDIIDGYHPDDEVVLSFCEEAVKIAPCYFVMGNHEADYPGYKNLRRQLTEIGVVFLKNRAEMIERNGDKITLIGIDDPNNSKNPDDADYMNTTLSELSADFSDYTVLLSHRPELFDVYVNHGIDLILSGHAHGGQIRLPLLGGVYVPSQGVFPKYDAGRFTDGDTTMIISRGLGKSRFPIRIGNRPEVVAVTLRHQD